MKSKVILLLTSLFIVISISTSCFNSKNKKPENDDIEIIELDSVALGIVWKYTDKIDPMTDDKVYFAQISPYEFLWKDNHNIEKIYFKLILRKMLNIDEVLVVISKDELRNNWLQRKSIKVRFDNNIQQEYQYTKEKDGPYDVLFIENSKDFIDNIKNSKKLIIQCEFIDQGLQTFTFTIHNLNWNN